MSELYDQIVQQRGSLERLVARLPGFRGYQDKQARRTADTMLRDYIAEQIKQRIQRLVSIEKIILDKLGMSLMPKTRDVKGKIQLYHDKVATRAPGYSGMWSQMKIGDEELEKIYSFDEAQIRYMDQVDEKLEALEIAAKSGEGVEDAIYALDTVVSEAIDALALRDDVLVKLSKST
jgi:hypothetical protein